MLFGSGCGDGGRERARAVTPAPTRPPAATEPPHETEPTAATRSSVAPSAVSSAASRTPAPKPPPPRNIDCGRVDCVSLTFDDGPGPHTERLLDTLRATGVRATFFVLGENVREHPGLVRRMVMEGHEVANHTWSHVKLTGLSREGVRSQIRRTQEAVKDAAGVEPTLMRPPYGATDDRVGRLVGMPQILWSVDTLDWLHRDADRDAKLGITKPDRGGIVLYHDIHKPTVDSIPRVIDGLKERGFTLVTVGELFRGEELKPGEAYTERNANAELLTGSPSPAGSPAGPSKKPPDER